MNVVGAGTNKLQHAGTIVGALLQLIHVPPEFLGGDGRGPQRGGVVQGNGRCRGGDGYRYAGGRSRCGGGTGGLPATLHQRPIPAIQPVILLELRHRLSLQRQLHLAGHRPQRNHVQGSGEAAQCPLLHRRPELISCRRHLRALLREHRLPLSSQFRVVGGGDDCRHLVGTRVYILVHQRERLIHLLLAAQRSVNLP